MKLKMRTITTEQPVLYENPGFELMDILCWDDDAVPLHVQPRPFMGIVVGFWHNGCIIDASEADPKKVVPLHETFENLCKLTRIERGA